MATWSFLPAKDDKESDNSSSSGGISAGGMMGSTFGSGVNSAYSERPVGSIAAHNTPEQNDARAAAADAGWEAMTPEQRAEVTRYVDSHGGGDGRGGPSSYAGGGSTRYGQAPNHLQGAPQWIQDNQWAARHGSAMPGERNGGSGPAFQSRPQGRGASPYDRYAQSQVPTQRPVYNAVGTTTTMPPRASMPSAGMSQAYGAGTTTYIPARPAQTPVQRTGSQGVSQAGAQQRAAMAALTDLATPTQQAGAQAAAQGLQGVPGLERFRR